MKPVKAVYKKENQPKRALGQPRVTEDKKLTRKQELFVKELVSNDGTITKREAAIRAGYPASSAHQRAYELTDPSRCPHVVKAIRQYRDELDKKYAVTYKNHVKDLKIIRDLAIEKGAFSAAVQAEYRRGQAQGDIYVSKSEIRHGTIESMSKDEVLKALEEIRQEYSGGSLGVGDIEEGSPEDNRSPVLEVATQSNQ